MYVKKMPTHILTVAFYLNVLFFFAIYNGAPSLFTN